MTGKNIRKLVLAALLAALTAVATMIIRIPTPTQGYIHLGDGMVLICGPTGSGKSTMLRCINALEEVSAR